MRASFSVDTHLFRELGELLVGRDSTALIELIKNAYDADATVVRVIGENLGSGSPGWIQVVDDGTGMTPEAFQAGFLTVASRVKELGDRRSKKYGRRFTGAKGVGRLAAHKLAALLEVESVPDPKVWVTVPDSSGLQAVMGMIDWDRVEAQPTLDAVASTDAVLVDRRPVDRDLPGTTLRLSRLRRPWTNRELTRFVREVESFDAPTFLVDPIPKRVIAAPLLFKRPLVRDASHPDPGFRVRLEGEFDTGDDLWQDLVDRMEWTIEIDSRSKPGKVLYAIAPTARTRQQNPYAVQRTFQEELARGEPQFHARIFVASGDAMQGLSSSVARWAQARSGVHVYMEGFRVLPYGEPGNDWLNIDRDTTTRTARGLRSFQDGRFGDGFSGDEDARRPELSMLASRYYYGAVFLTQEDAPGLQMLVNREGFLPNRHLDTIEQIVRGGIDLSVRLRASARYQQKEAAGQGEPDLPPSTDASPPSSIPPRGRHEPSPPVPRSPSQRLGTSVGSLIQKVREARASLAAGDAEAAREALEAAEIAMSEARASLEEADSQLVLLRDIASVGTQMSAFTHDLNSLVNTSTLLSRVLDDLSSDQSIPTQARKRLREVHRTFLTVRQTLDRFASYLIDVVSPDARRRRSRQRARERLDAAWRLVEHRARERGVTLVNRIEEEHRTPPMFPSELTSVFLNLLSNAVKAAGEGGEIVGRSKLGPDGALTIVMENTGAYVDPDEGERWFLPFESTTTRPDPVLGQGMGLGLPIVRRVLEEVGASIRFIHPSGPPFETALEITFPAS